MLEVIKLKEEISDFRSQIDAVKEKVKLEKRALTEEEEATLETLKSEIDKRNADIVAYEKQLQEDAEKAKLEAEKRALETEKEKQELEKRSLQQNKNINVNKMNKLQYRFKQAVDNREYNRDIKLDKRSITVTGEDGMHDALIQEDFTEILEPLYANSILTKLGIQTRRNQVNDVHVPKMSKGTVGFIGEIEPATATGFEFNYITLRPKRIAAYYDISEMALIQDAIGCFDACQKNLVAKVDEYIEQEIFSATAATDLRPAGMFYNVTPTEVETFADLCELEAGVEEANVSGNMKYALSPRAKSYFRQLIKGTNATGMVYEYGEMDGIPTEVTSAVPAYKFVYGNWNNFLFCSWNDGMMKISDSATGLITGEVRVYLAAYIDWAVLRPEAFAFGVVKHE